MLKVSRSNWETSPLNLDGTSASGSENLIYIDSPNYSQSSNGIKCIYDLAQKLNKRGIEIRLVPRNIRGFVTTLPADLKEIRACPPWAMQARATMICTESVPTSTIKQARRKGIKILWWFLAPYNLLERSPVKPRRGEKVLTFSPFVYPNEDYYYFQPDLDKHWRRALATFRPSSDNKPMVIGLYCGKGRLRAIPKDIQEYMYGSNIKIITRTFPATRKKLFQLISKLDGLITFDELTQLNLEAASLGVPVFVANQLFPAKCLKMFPVNLSDMMTSRSERFIYNVIKRRQGKTKGIPDESMKILNESTISRLINVLNKDEWAWTESYKSRVEDIFKFGKSLRKKHALYPFFQGQSAGASLIKFYIFSISLSPSSHKLICFFISILDELSRLFVMIGASNLFDKLNRYIKKLRPRRKVKLKKQKK